MKLLIKKGDKERKFPLPIPKRLIVKALLKEAGIRGPSPLKNILRTLKEYKKEYGAFTLVEVEEKDGSVVKIIV